MEMKNTTIPDKKMNKVIAGFHMLMIISHSDGEFSPEEGLEIVEYMSESFPFDVALDNEIDFLSKLRPDDYFNHFTRAMNDFYLDSNEKERIQFLDKAVKIVMADKKITKEENIFLMEIFNAWDAEHEL
jgi:uncharacterized tellurite resistance protein B-like protein